MNLKPAPKTLFLNVYVLNSTGEGPRFATVTVTDELVKRILKLSDLVHFNGLLSAVVEESVSEWDADDEYRIECDVLDVRLDSFFWRAYSSRGDFAVETGTMPIEILRQFHQSTDNFLVYADGCSDLGLTMIVRESLMNEARLASIPASVADLDAIANCEDSSAAISQLLALLHWSSTQFSTPDCPDCLCVQDGHCLCIPSKPPAGASAL